MLLKIYYSIKNVSFIHCLKIGWTICITRENLFYSIGGKKKREEKTSEKCDNSQVIVPLSTSLERKWHHRHLVPEAIEEWE